MVHLSRTAGRLALSNGIARSSQMPTIHNHTQQGVNQGLGTRSQAGCLDTLNCISDSAASGRVGCLPRTKRVGFSTSASRAAVKSSALSSLYTIMSHVSKVTRFQRQVLPGAVDLRGWLHVPPELIVHARLTC